MTTDWKSKPLVELTTLFADGDWIESKDQSPMGIRLIQTGNIGEGLFKDRGEKARYISLDTFKRLRCTEILPGDCLVSRLPDPVGRACILPDVGEHMITAVDCTIIRFDPEQLLPEFFTYFSQSLQYLSAVDRECTGTTRKRIGRSKLGEVQVPVPTLPEQERMVAILDEAFANIAIAKANTEKALKYVEEAASSQLFQIFEEQYSKYANVELKELTQSISDGDHAPPPKAAQGVPFITIGNIKKEQLKVDFTDTFKVTRAYFDGLQPNRRPQPGDVLYTVTGSYGIPVLVEDDIEFCFQRHIGLVRPKTTTCSRWLFFLFQTPQLKRQADHGATGTAQKTVSLGLLRSLSVPNTPHSEQVRCALACEQIRAQTQQAAMVYQRKLVALEELKKSLLHQAFSGQL
jgi:type I restriction enzyme S subunit